MDLTEVNAEARFLPTPTFDFVVVVASPAMPLKPASTKELLLTR